MKDIYVCWDKKEGRLEAMLWVASHQKVQDAEIGRHEAGCGLYTEDEPFRYEPGDEGETYEDIYGKRVPQGLHAFSSDGDLWLGAHVDLDSDAGEEEKRDAWRQLETSLEKVGFKPVWLGKEWSEA